VAVVIVLPSIGLLFTLVQRNMVEETARPVSAENGGATGAAGTNH
jgi:hypothetical protein